MRPAAHPTPEQIADLETAPGRSWIWPAAAAVVACVVFATLDRLTVGPRVIGPPRPRVIPKAFVAPAAPAPAAPAAKVALVLAAPPPVVIFSPPPQPPLAALNVLPPVPSSRAAEPAGTGRSK